MDELRPPDKEQSQQGSSQPAHDRPRIYRIRLKGAFDEAWLGYWFEGFVISGESPGETTLTGAVVDDAALHGLLANLRDLGLRLLYLERIEDQDE